MNEVVAEQIGLLPDYLGRHLLLTLLALGTGIAISLPVGVLVTHYRALRGPVLTVASVLQTVPSLALLALMVAALSRIGFLPAYLALVLYSVLPVLRNTVTGMDGLEPSVVEAARGIGMTPAQILMRVRLPLAMPVIIAGIRTATVWTVGITTLSTPVGATSLGNYIFSGLQTQNTTAIVVGCVAAAALAVVLDGLIRVLEVTVRTRRRSGMAAASIALVLIFAGGVAPVALDVFQTRQAAAAADATSAEPGASRATTRLRQKRAVVGAKGFTEQYIVARVMSTLLERAGYTVELRENLGSVVVFEAASTGEIDCYLEYSGTAWANYMNEDYNPGKAAVKACVTTWLKQKHDMRTLGPAGFENLYTLAMRADDARGRGIKSIEDLLPVARDLTIGSDYEFFHRPEWKTLRNTYDIDFREKLSFDPALMYPAIDEGQVDVITAYSTDGRIAAYDLRVLADPRNAFLPYDGLIVLSADAASESEFVSALAPMINAISDERMREANRLVDVDQRSLGEAVDWVLKAIPSE